MKHQHVFSGAMALVSLGLIVSAALAQGPEHFEGTFPPDGWALYQMGDASSGWFQTSPGYESDHCAAHMWEDHDCDNWLVTPAVIIPSIKFPPPDPFPAGLLLLQHV